MGCGAGTARATKPGPSAPGSSYAAKQKEQPETQPDMQARQRTEPALPRPVTAPGEGLTVTETPRKMERQLEPVAAEEVDLAQLKPRLEAYVPGSHPQAQRIRKLLLDVVDVLAGGLGGVILAIVDRDLVKDLQFSYLDNGLLMKLCREVCPSIQESPENFQAMLQHFCAHSETDRWSQQELENLAAKLPKAAAPLLAPLEGNPKDGAFVFSHSGTIVAAAGHLRYSSERWQLLRADGGSCGTRHAAGLALAEWLGQSGSLGAVFVRSDGGGVHALLPRRDEEPPLVFHFDSLRHATQQEMLRLFRKRIMEHGRLMQKATPAMIRPGVKGERVVTCVNGRVISEVIIGDETSMVIRANTDSKELYVLPREKFDQNWEPNCEPCEEETREGRKSEFKLHKPKQGIQKWIYQITNADLGLVPTGWFEAAWGAMQPLREGDFLAMPAPEERATEVYLMDPDCVSCYAVAGSEAEEAAVTNHHRTQSEMMEIFKDLIIRQGRLMCKVEPCMSRPGKRGERVVTCVNARIISDVTIEDDTSMVVRAPTMDQELYVLPKEKFQANWVAEAMDLDQSSPVNTLLAQQGFKLYKPKPNLKWIYAVTQEDMAHVPTGCFYSSFQALQPVQAGDYLAMPAPEERATEVYLMPKEVLTCYREAKEDSRQREEAEAQQGLCTQEEMIRLFADRIRTHGCLMVKDRPGMMRPGRRGDRVVTYVGGRVTSDTVIEDDTSMIVRAPTVDHEEYVLPRDKFEANWEPEGEPLDELDPGLAPLRARGFRLHRPKPSRKWVYRLEAADLELVPGRSFAAAWGASQPLREGDCLAMPERRAPEVYLMPMDVLDCYRECSDDGEADPGSPPEAPLPSFL